MAVVGLAGAVHPDGQQLEVSPAVRRDHDHFAVEDDVTHG
jgi:hypothetical protein